MITRNMVTGASTSFFAEECDLELQSPLGKHPKARGRADVGPDVVGPFDGFFEGMFGSINVYNF